MSNLLDHVEQSVVARKLFRRGERILVAVSGGLDSMALLHMLHALAPKNGWKLAIAHFNHKLRARSSDADERLVRNTVATLKMPFVAGRADVKFRAKKQGVSIEMAARKLRHEFLARSARKLHASTIAIAHHAGDQVELFFLRLLRGSGGEGLAGMKWRAASPADSKIALTRPLLDVSKTDLEKFARENKIRFRLDASNTSLDFRRNRIRCELLPLLRKNYQPALDRTVLRTMEIIGDEAEFVMLAARAWLGGKRGEPFDKLLPAIQRRVIQWQLLKRNIAPDFEMVELLRTHANRPVSLSPHCSVFRDAAGIVHLLMHLPVSFTSTQLAVKLDGRAGEVFFDEMQFWWELEDQRSVQRVPRVRRCECFDADEIGPEIVLRHWRPGDRFQPIGLRGAVKLQDWFTNQKIPRTERHKLVFATTTAGEIFWIEGQRISERFKLTPGTKRRLLWRWNRA